MFTVSEKYEDARYLVFIVDICNCGWFAICWEIVEKAPFDYSVFEQILIFFNMRPFG
jgi:hypothetical protein